MKYHPPMTSHHLIPKSMAGNGRPNNIILLNETVHRACHTLYANRTPIGRIRSSIETDKKVIKPHFYAEINRILTILEREEVEIYENDCFDKDRFIDIIKNDI